MKSLNIVILALVQFAWISGSWSSCGISRITDSYTQSVEAKIGAFPWSAFIVHADNRAICNAVLIDKRHVLTKYECVEPSRNATSIGLGGHDVTAVEAGECRNSVCPDGNTLLFGIEKVIPHPSYDKNNRFLHSIAVIRLDQEVEFTDKISPICLPSDIENLPELIEGDKVIAVGWGKTSTNESPVKVQQAILGIVSSQESCKDTYKKLDIDFNDIEFCAGVENDGDPATCAGFSGSPSMRKIGEKWVLYGLVAFGTVPCNLKRSPSVNYKASFYNDWIKSVI